MKNCRIAIAVLFIFCSSNVFAQESDSSSYYKKQYVKIYKEYVSDPSDVATIVTLADFYSRMQNPMRNLPLAMQYIRQAESSYIEILADESRYRELNRLVRKKITITSIRQKKEEILNITKQYLESSPKMSDIEIDCFSEQFGQESIVSSLIKTLKINQLSRRIADNPTIDAYYIMVKDYGGTHEAEVAEEELARQAAAIFSRMSTKEEVDSIAARYPESAAIQRVAAQRNADLAYLKAEQTGTPSAYQKYLSQYPSGQYYIDVLDKMDSLLAIEYATINDASGYIEFIKNHGDNPLAEKAMQQLRHKIIDEQDPAATTLYLENFPLDPDYNDIFKLFYTWHSYEGNRTPIEEFAQKYPNYPFQIVMQSDLTQSTRIDAFNLMKPYSPANAEEYASFIRMNTGKKIAFVGMQRILQHDRSTHNWKSALAHLEAHEISFETDCAEEYKQLKQMLTAKNAYIPTSELSPTFNLSHPVVHPNDTLMYYNCDRQIYKAKYVRKKKSGSWVSEGPIAFDNSENLNYEIFSLYEEGTRMLLGKAGDIYEAEAHNGTWHIVGKLPEPVNTAHTETDAYMLPDGSGMLLASDRPGGHNIQKSGIYFHGDTALASDIYYIPLTAKGWGTPINLGKDINSQYCERCPILSSDMQTLYFVTDGRGGLGYGDIYTAIRKDNSWTQWTTPQNLGREVNSGFNEASLSFNHNESRLYYATQTANNNYYCYSVHINNQIDSTLRLSLTPSVWTNLSGHIELKGYTAERLKNEKATIALPRVTFHKSEEIKEFLHNDAELDILAEYLNSHQDLTIDIITHSNDSSDLESHTQTLHRGQSIKQYLVQHGVDTNRMTVSPYGNAITKTGVKSPEVAIKFL